MSATERDYYELLGVARDADEREIKKAFRALARQLHPDVSEDPEADVRFREVSEAYEVLSNAETRQLYDRYGHAGLRSGGFTPTHFDVGSLGDLFSAFFGDDLFGGRGPAAARGADVPAEIEIDLVDAARGTTAEVKLEVAVTCAHVRRRRRPARHERHDLPALRRPRPAAAGLAQPLRRVRPHARPARSASGSGRKIEHPCETCAGAGRTLEERSLEVERARPASTTGSASASPGEGHAGALGGRAGDLYVAVRVRPDERFVREGNDMFSQVDLTIVQAALGATVAVETLDGPVELEFEPGTQPGAGARRSAATACRCSRASAAATTACSSTSRVPRRLTDEQRRLLEEFERLSDDETYRPDEGFFEKLKSAFR